ncbi:MAG TPA: FMN-binding protein [Propionibacteriaceae bacterium]|nr:FMN-binding protein [Propionibacteriaceae bacterium]
MSTYGKAASVLASAGVIAAGWSIGTAGGETLTLEPTATTTVTTTATATRTVTETPADDEYEDSHETDDDSSATSTPTATRTATGSSTTATGSVASTATGTFTGETATNQFGTVTVTVTLSNGTITDVRAAAVANDGHSQRIVQQALPVLKAAVLAAQSADISTVGGATYTSHSYISSLQSALDQA